MITVFLVSCQQRALLVNAAALIPLASHFPKAILTSWLAKRREAEKCLGLIDHSGRGGAFKHRCSLPYPTIATMQGEVLGEEVAMDEKQRHCSGFT